MKKLFTLLAALITAVRIFAQTPAATYTLPLDLASNQTVDAVAQIGDIGPNVSYIDLTSMITKLQGDLGAQTDNLNTNKNLLQIYTPMAVNLENPATYPDTQKREALTNSYNNAMKTVKGNVETSKKNIEKINADIAKITKVINNRMNIEQSQQNFRQWTSFIFAGLLAIIIGGFFYILFRSDNNNLASLLMGESGLQFITLFSLIISIILFGVLNILEGKELAAIISAIAGFILGKYDPAKVGGAAGGGAGNGGNPPPGGGGNGGNAGDGK
ncbi:hypothetical protein HQ865_03445 [Mucilaginibacter mali]|uniref:Uncharacterized protein n=1 Tax=Mucilaginibacter mali TaxID=2740462 RepID=A0A7D4Q1B3_9SPHI|nr:hypothetical protein [Mucilaginibacter mali]QKJ28847.1 hypothetical protein HQ865_03445 [Mucilaginibacter mali]